MQYGDYAVWQREWLQGEVLDQQLAYWRKQLAGAPPVLDLPTDYPRPASAELSWERRSRCGCRVGLTQAERVDRDGRRDAVHDAVGGV